MYQTEIVNKTICSYCCRLLHVFVGNTNIQILIDDNFTKVEVRSSVSSDETEGPK